MVAVDPDCSSVPTPLCEREGEYVLDVVEEGACCPKKICGEGKRCVCQAERMIHKGKSAEHILERGLSVFLLLSYL